MNFLDYFNEFEKEHGRMPTFEEFCRDCPPKATYIIEQVKEQEGKLGWLIRWLREVGAGIRRI